VSTAALWPSRWPAEDGGPSRRQTARGAAPRIVDGERLTLAAHRDAYAATMLVLRDPGELFALRHTMGIHPLTDPSTCWVERLDPLTLEPLSRSPDLPGGPFWPGGLAAHANGELYVVHGNHCHRLSSGLELLASRRLARERPHNSFVVLSDGSLAIKDLDLDLRVRAELSLLDPTTLEPRCPSLILPEPAVARLSADGNTVYAVGTETIWRAHWDGSALALDEGWHHRYHGGPAHSYGWDPVIAGGHVWFLDNGAHAYATTMRGAGRSAGPVRLIRVAVADSGDAETIDVSGLPHGAVTNPPLYDDERRIAVAFDSANGVVQAFRFADGRLSLLWRRELSHAGHMVHYPESGELVLHDYRGPALARTAIARALANRSSRAASLPAVRRTLAARSADEVIVVDIETGVERSRIRVPTMFQSVLFPAPGFGRDLYWCTFSTLARLEVTSET
jgi:hypothetical protein